MNPWLFCFLCFLAGMLCSHLALTTFRAELLGWQKRRQARKLTLAMAEKIACPAPHFPESGEGPFVLEGGLDANRPRLIQFASRLHAQDRRRFFLGGDKEKN